MKENYVVHRFTLTDSDKQKFSKKLKRFDRIFPENTEITVNIETIGKQEIVELTIFDKGTFYRAEKTSDSALNSLDEAIETIEGQIRKYKTKLQKRFHPTEFKAFIEEENVDEEEFSITKVKRFEYNPMTAEEAILQMNLLGHSFYVFNDIETDGVCVVYKRKDNEYGLIEQDK